ncbi:MAG: HEPN domain-containing protein [bacterium]
MITENLRALVRYRVEQAHDAIRAGELALKEALYRDALNRFYYAMFYGVLALLATRKMETSKHKGAISLFDKEFVNRGLLSKDLSAWLHDAFERRMKGDYKEFATATREESEKLLTHAEEFVAQVKAHLAEYLS